ncbi:MAG: KEOPS complex subunit Pcc1 [Halodesulfurarchaeum sp.]
MHETTIDFSYPSAGQAKLVESALRPEVGDIDSDRTAVSIARRGAELELVVEASDTVALRAGQNTWLGLVEVAETVTEVGRRFDDGRET